MTAPTDDGAVTTEAEKISAWWFSASDRLPHGDDRLIVIGESHSVQGNIVLCENALHASRDPFDALSYATGEYLYRVRCWGDVVEEDDKLGARHREYVAMRDATNMLRRFAREQALSVIHLWEAPEVVKTYLETGDESLRAASWAGAYAWAAAGDAVRAVRAAATSSAAATSATAATAAWTAAMDAALAAGNAGGVAARERFNELVAELFGGDLP